jgi:hypothetical protein
MVARRNQTSLKSLCAALVVTCIVVFSTAIAGAKDFGTMTRMLYAADLADQANAFCSLASPTFDNELRGTLGNMHAYMQHIKMEVTYRLSQSEALMILKAAADAAKADMYGVLRRIKNEPGTPDDRIRAWCSTIAKPLIGEVIATHDQHHAEIDALLDKAKR